MSGPLVSAIMPAYQAERFLRPAIESVLAQDYEPFEVIVVDDGSTDATPDILREYPALRVIRQENAGPAAACNTAIAAARGEFVARFDADDLWPAERLSIQVAHLLAHPEVGCAMGRQDWIDPPAWLTRDAVYGELDGIPLVSAMFRRSALEAIGGFDESFVHGEDMDVLIRMRERGIGVAVLPDMLVRRRFHGDNLTAHAPQENPLLRSIRMKLERERAAAAKGGA